MPSCCLARPVNARETARMTEPHSHPTDWRLDGVRVIRGDQLDPNTAQTPGM